MHGHRAGTRGRWDHGHFHHRRGGPPHWGHQGRWWTGWMGPPPWARRRARRGDVRTAILAVLAEKRLHGYDLIRELEERSGGAWRPSPGSIYPTLQMLEEEGLLDGEEQDGKRVYSLTDGGRAELEARRERAEGTDPWDVGEVPEGFLRLRDAGYQLAAAAMQVARAGDRAQVDRAAEILSEARRRLYEILAED